MKPITRRKAVATIGLASAGVCVCGLNGGCATFTKKGKTEALDTAAYLIEGKSVKIALDKAPLLGAVGGSVKLIDARLPTSLIVARTGAADYVAVSLHCPHRGVEVEYQHEHQCFSCASLGNSKFGTDGSLKKGLAKKGLTQYEAKLDPAQANCLILQEKKPAKS